MGDLAQCGQAIQHRVAAIVAVVGKQKKIGEAYAAMMRQPFEQERALVANSQDGEDAQCLASIAAIMS